MARSILSLGIDWARAFCTARRRRALNAGSGMPSLAATVISRASLENTFERAASDLPLRCMIFLACEWPAMRSPLVSEAELNGRAYSQIAAACEAGSERRFHLRQRAADPERRQLGDEAGPRI